MGTVGEAFELALAAHAGQTDKLGEPYIAHVVRVAARTGSDDQRIVALLHDVVEDTDVTLETVEARFGAEIAAAVDAITHRAGEPRADYLVRVRANRLAAAVKRADLADNANPARLARLDGDTRRRLEKKYAQAAAILNETATD